MAVLATDFSMFGILRHHVNNDRSGARAYFASAIWCLCAAFVLLFFAMIIVTFTCFSARREKKTDKERLEGIWCGCGAAKEEEVRLLVTSKNDGYGRALGNTSKAMSTNIRDLVTAQRWVTAFLCEPGTGLSPTDGHPTIEWNDKQGLLQAEVSQRAHVCSWEASCRGEGGVCKGCLTKGFIRSTAFRNQLVTLLYFSTLFAASHLLAGVSSMATASRTQ